MGAEKLREILRRIYHWPGWDVTLGEMWCRIFGHRWDDPFLECMTCGQEWWKMER